LEQKGRFEHDTIEKAAHDQNRIGANEFTYKIVLSYCICVEPIFDHEKLDVYGLQLQFVAWTADFLIEASQSPVPHRRELLDQLDRACLSILLNTAEGNGKRQGLQRAKFFGDARGSALECAACLDASVAKRIAKSDRIHSGKQLLIRIVAMLTRLVERFDPDEFQVRQNELNA
jgi:four helix bundle protein